MEEYHSLEKCKNDGESFKIPARIYLQPEYVQLGTTSVASTSSWLFKLQKSLQPHVLQHGVFVPGVRGDGQLEPQPRVCKEPNQEAQGGEHDGHPEVH